MKKYYRVTFGRGSFEIVSNYPWSIIVKYAQYSEKERIPEDTVFRIKKGKRSYDIITYFQDWCIRYYSQKFIDILSRFVNMSDKCYPIKISDLEEQYYAIHNLKEVLHFNVKETFFGKPRESTMFLAVEDNMTPIVTFSDSYVLIIDETVKEAMVKAKLTNISFEEVFGCTQEEYEEWKLKHLKTDSLKS